MYRKRPIHRLITVLSAVSLAGLGLLSSSASANTPTVPPTAVSSQPKTPKPLPGPKPQAVKQSGTPLAAGENSCAAVLTQGSERTTEGQRNVACIKPGPRPALRTDNNQLTPEARALKARTPIPLPDWCYQESPSGWWLMRTEACSISSWILDVYERPSNKLVGQMTYLQADLIATDSTLSAWNHQVAISMTGGWGLGLGTSLSGTGSCSGACTTEDIDFPKQAVKLDNAPFGYVVVNSTVSASGATGTGKTTVTYEFTNPKWTIPIAPVKSTPPMKTRCDNAVPGKNSVGCVFPDYVSVNLVSKTGLYPNYARHLQDAQASGLPGAYPDGAPLHRLVDEVKQTANRNTACPQAANGGYPRPTGFSCDEYPFASSREGAAQATPPYPGRTFGWCQIGALPSGSGAKAGVLA